MKKNVRQNKIIELINTYDIDTQEELANKLIESGFIVTQSTVSRDIKELKLTKTTGKNGRQKYCKVIKSETGVSDKYTRVMQDAFLSADVAGNLLVIKTAAGMAMAVAAVIDSLHLSKVLGCIAGDDTIFCALRSPEDASEVMNKLIKIASH